ncbi:MAG: hypothetical protein ACREC0_12345 [Methylocella sp.]
MGQRAFVNVKSVEFKSDVENGKTTDVLAPWIENTGNSPATRVSFGAKCLVHENDGSPVGIPVVDFSPFIVISAKGGWQGQTCSVPYISKDNEVVPQPYYFLVFIQYEDIFDECHVSMLCGYVGWKNGQRWTSVCNPTCADKNCPNQCNEGVFSPLASRAMIPAFVPFPK